MASRRPSPTSPSLSSSASCPPIGSLIRRPLGLGRRASRRIPSSLGRSEQAALLEALPEEPCRAVNFADAAKIEGGFVAVLRGRNLGEEVEGEPRRAAARST